MMDPDPASPRSRSEDEWSVLDGPTTERTTVAAAQGPPANEEGAELALSAVVEDEDEESLERASRDFIDALSGRPSRGHLGRANWVHGEVGWHVPHSQSLSLPSDECPYINPEAIPVSTPGPSRPSSSPSSREDRCSDYEHLKPFEDEGSDQEEDPGSFDGESSQASQEDLEMMRQVSARQLEADIRAASTPPKVKLPETSHWHKILVAGGPKLGKTKFLQSLLASFPQQEGEIPDDSDSEAWEHDPEAFAATVQLTDPVTKATHNFVLQDTPSCGNWIRQASYYVRDCKCKYSRMEENSARSVPMDTLEDPRVDVCLYFIPPHHFSQTEAEQLALLSIQVPVIPIMAKADSMTQEELEAHRADIEDKLDASGCEWRYGVLEPEVLAEADAPPSGVFAVVASTDLDFSTSSSGWPVRKYRWGVVEAMSSAHSDLLRLRRLLFEVGPPALKQEKELRYLQPARMPLWDALRTLQMVPWLADVCSTSVGAVRACLACILVCLFLINAFLIVGLGRQALFQAHPNAHNPVNLSATPAAFKASVPPPGIYSKVDRLLDEAAGNAVSVTAAFKLVVEDLAADTNLDKTRRQHLSRVSGKLAALQHANPAQNPKSESEAAESAGWPWKELWQVHPSEAAERAAPPEDGIAGSLLPHSGSNIKQAQPRSSRGEPGFEPKAHQDPKGKQECHAQIKGSAANLTGSGRQPYLEHLEAKVERHLKELGSVFKRSKAKLDKRVAKHLGKAAKGTGKLLKRLDPKHSLRNMVAAVQDVDSKRLLRRILAAQAWL